MNTQNIRADAPSPTGNLSPEAAQQQLKAGAITLVDVREPAEYAAEHINGSVPHPLATLDMQQIANESGGRVVVFTCLSGKRAGMAQARFREITGEDCACMEGSLAGWKRAGLPVVAAKRVISLERQVMIVAGSVVLAGALLAAFYHSNFIWLSGGVGAGLLFAGMSGSCMLKRLLLQLPFNRQSIS